VSSSSFSRTRSAAALVAGVEIVMTFCNSCSRERAPDVEQLGISDLEYLGSIDAVG
jgi:hypothetical protein